MKTMIKSTVLAAVLLPAAIVGFSGCAATQVALDRKDLKVQTQMSSTVFLDLDNRTVKTVFIDIKNTSGRDLTLEPTVRAQLQQAGYQILSEPKPAFYILQVNVRHVGETSPNAMAASMRSGYGGPVPGAVTGAAIASSTNTRNANLKGAAIGMAIDMIFASLVRDVTYSIVTDIQITERTNASVTEKMQTTLHQGAGTDAVQTSENASHRRKYETRIVSTANRVNLKFEDALPALQQQLAKSIAGIL
jgi:hypothetical protein